MLSTVNYSLSQTWQTGEQASPARHVFLSPHLWSTLPSPEVFPLTGGTGNSLPSMLDSHWHLSGPTHSESSLSTGHQNNTTHTEDTSSTILVFDCLEYLWLQFPYLQNGVKVMWATYLTNPFGSSWVWLSSPNELHTKNKDLWIC